MFQSIKLVPSVYICKQIAWHCSSGSAWNPNNKEEEVATTMVKQQFLFYYTMPPLLNLIEQVVIPLLHKTLCSTMSLMPPSFILTKPRRPWMVTPPLKPLTLLLPITTTTKLSFLEKRRESNFWIIIRGGLYIVQEEDWWPRELCALIVEWQERD